MLRAGGEEWLHLSSPLLEINHDEPIGVTPSSSTCIERLLFVMTSWCLPHTCIRLSTLSAPFSRLGRSERPRLSPVTFRQCLFAPLPLHPLGLMSLVQLSTCGTVNILLIKKCSTLPPLPRLLRHKHYICEVTRITIKRTSQRITRQARLLADTL